MYNPQIEKSDHSLFS